MWGREGDERRYAGGWMGWGQRWPFHERSRSAQTRVTRYTASLSSVPYTLYISLPRSRSFVCARPLLRAGAEKSPFGLCSGGSGIWYRRTRLRPFLRPRGAFAHTPGPTNKVCVLGFTSWFEIFTLSCCRALWSPGASQNGFRPPVFEPRPPNNHRRAPRLVPGHVICHGSTCGDLGEAPRSRNACWLFDFVNSVSRSSRPPPPLSRFYTNSTQQYDGDAFMASYPKYPSILGPLRFRHQPQGVASNPT